MSLDFDSLNPDWCKVDSDVVGDYPFTFAAWINPDSLTGIVNAIIGISVDGATNHQQAIFVWTGTTLAAAYCNDGSASGYASSTTTISAGTWYHVSGVFASSTSRKIFINAVEEDENTTDVAHSASLDVSSMGAYLSSGTTPQTNISFNGKIAYPHIYNRALNADEIAEIMHKPYSISDGLVAAWDTLSSFAAVTDIKDMSPGGNDIEGGTAPTLSNVEPPVYFPNT